MTVGAVHGDPPLIFRLADGDPPAAAARGAASVRLATKIPAVGRHQPFVGLVHDLCLLIKIFAAGAKIVHFRYFSAALRKFSATSFLNVARESSTSFLADSMPFRALSLSAIARGMSISSTSKTLSAMMAA